MLHFLSSLFAVFTHGENRSAQLTLDGWVSCADLVKIGECCLALVILLGQTVNLAVFPQNLFTKVLCDPVFPSLGSTQLLLRLRLLHCTGYASDDAFQMAFIKRGTMLLCHGCICAESAWNKANKNP